MRNRIIRLILAFTLVLLSVFAGSNNDFAAGDAWLTGWSSRIRITIDHAKIGSPLSNFPVKLHLSTASGIGSHDISTVFVELTSDASRKKIAVTASDGVTQCYVEIERWDTANKQAILWVRVPSVSMAEDTILYFYYDSTHAENTTYIGDIGSIPGQAVWDSNFVSVHHFSEQGNGIAGEYKDSTGNMHNGQGGSAFGKSSPVRAPDNIMGFTQDFNGINDFLILPDADGYSVLTTGDLEVDFWLAVAVVNNPTAITTDKYIVYMTKEYDVSHTPPDAQEWQFVLYNQNSPTRPQWVSMYVKSETGVLGSGSNNVAGDFQPGIWHNITGYVHADSPTVGTINIYRDTAYNQAGGQSYFSDYNVKIGNYTAPVRIGSYTGVGTDSWYNGSLGELRISKVQRSAAWRKASYDSTKDQLLAYGSRETANSAPSLNAIGNKTINEGSLLSFIISASDPNGDTLAYSAANLPAGASFTPATRTFSWSPSLGQAGSYTNVRFDVTDGLMTASENITITVNRLSPVFSNLSAPGINYGMFPTSLSGTIKSGTLIPTGSVSITLNGVTQTATVDGTGNFSSSFDTSTLPPGGSPYTISYIYAGDANFNNVSDTSKTLIVNSIAATVTLGSLSQTYSGTARNATATTAPPGLSVSFIYNGSSTAPINAGSYTVLAKVTTTGFSGSSTGTLVIAKATPVFNSLSFPSINYGVTPTGLSGTLKSGTLIPTGSVSVTLNGVTQTAAIDGSGNFSSSFATGSLTTGASPYTISYVYTGDMDFNGSTDYTKTLTVTLPYVAWDVNMDGHANVLDLIIVGQHLGETGTPGWIRADINGDGVVNVLDYIIIGQHWTG